MSEDQLPLPPRPGQPAGAGAYLQSQLAQASPAQQLLMLLDGVIRFTLQAKEAIGRQDIAARHAANRRAIEIVTYLLGQQEPAHDTSPDGQAAASLARIYARLAHLLMRIDFENSQALCDTVVAHVRQLRAGFASLQPAATKVVAAPEAATPRTLAASA